MAQVQHVLFVGAAYVDTLLYLPAYPQEDSKVPAEARELRRGGNAPNSAVTLAQFPARSSHLAAALGDESESRFFLADLTRNDVDVSACVHRPGLPAPSSYILVGREAGSRTVISYNRVPELTLEELCTAYQRLSDGCDGGISWVHFEGRNPFAVQAFVHWLRKLPVQPRISAECEKPNRPGLRELLPLVDVVFFSRLFAEAVLQSSGVADTASGRVPGEVFLHHIRTQCRPGALLFCTWGADGAYSIHAPMDPLDTVDSTKVSTCEVIHTPACLPTPTATVVDPVGSGDAFTAGVLHQLLSLVPHANHRNDHEETKAVGWMGDRCQVAAAAARTGCQVAGQKVAQTGFSGIGAAWQATFANN
ncbi:Ribokinase-like protein [Thamnocephalis sphaerospora]|uniref:Ribokinase-like protein n=1 Tax=Thamnocephalis sphaerospora TaxID=78915 RepID=A0A4P9XIL2_9FUNG|nr:Ribokinase-like protein [Thamnocephalis sphaerospora]|eukprot:RKP05547.1 Ribokinase-like protein [Thamnocephalis sphaerospora]